jgi:hypothetical protein
MVGGQKIQVGLAHARKIVQVSVGPDTYQITVETGTSVTAPRTASRDIRRHRRQTMADDRCSAAPGIGR